MDLYVHAPPYPSTFDTRLRRNVQHESLMDIESVSARRQRTLTKEISDNGSHVYSIMTLCISFGSTHKWSSDRDMENKSPMDHKVYIFH